MDFVITDYFNAEVYLYQGDGNGGFTKKFLFDVAGNYQAEEITSGDFNGDGHLDIIVDDFVPHGGGAYLYTGNIENGTLEFVYQGPVFSRPLLVGSTYYGNVYGVDSYDFDKDGHRDLILSTYEYPPVGLVFVMRGKGNGTFWPPEPIPTPPFDTLGSVFPVTPSQVPRDMSLTVVSLVGDLVSNSSTGPFVPATTAYLAGRQLPRDDGGLDKYVRIKDAYWIWMDNFIGDMTNPLYFTKTFQIPGSAIDIIGTMEVSTDNYS